MSTTATARVRELSRGGGRKYDRIDAAATASVAALQGDARPVHPETTADSLALLDERRVSSSQSRTRSMNQLHALLRELMAGGAPTSLTAATATPGTACSSPPHRYRSVRLALAKDLIAYVRRFDQQLAANTATMNALLDEHGTRLREIDGIGPVLAARLLRLTGHESRFVSEAAYANSTGTAPVQMASAESNRHRLSRYGDRQLNSAIHTVAMIQIRMRASAGRAYYNKKIAEGNPPRRRSAGAQTPPRRTPVASHTRRRKARRPNSSGINRKCLLTYRKCLLTYREAPPACAQVFPSHSFSWARVGCCGLVGCCTFPPYG